MCCVVTVPGKCILSCAVGFQRGLHESPVSLLKSPALGCALFFMQIGLTLWDNTLHGHISAIWKKTFWGFTFYIYLNNNKILFDFLTMHLSRESSETSPLGREKNVSTVSQFNSDLVKLSQGLIKKGLKNVISVRTFSWPSCYLCDHPADEGCIELSHHHCIVAFSISLYWSHLKTMALLN